jgi:uncharacterized Rmd1/YagE family protein
LTVITSTEGTARTASPADAAANRSRLPEGLVRRPQINVRALYLGERIDLGRFAPDDRLGANPLLIALGAEGAAAISRFGVVVLFNAAPDRENTLLRDLLPLVNQPTHRTETESLVLCVDADREERIENGILFLREMTVERLQLVAWVLSRSVVLAEYESRISANFDRVEPFALELQTRGRGGPKMKELLEQIGSVLLTEHKLVARVEVREKPELLWDHPALDPLFLRLQSEFELNDRFAAFDRKLDLLSRTVSTVLNLLQNRRSLRVEWYIIILIVFEILLTLYAMFVRPG